MDMSIASSSIIFTLRFEIIDKFNSKFILLDYIKIKVQIPFFLINRYFNSSLAISTLLSA